MDLSRFPRRKYTNYKTPLEKLEHLSKKIGGPNIYMKRDDLLGLTAGGNKTRKLEFLVADAIEKGADTLITIGGVQSNHCRLTLAAAVKEQMKCILILEESKATDFDTVTNGNYFLYELLGAESIKVVPHGTDLLEEMKKVEEQVIEDGGKPYTIPIGGSNVIGATGYVACAQEILQQSFDLGIEMDHVVCASGSAGMHSGLVAGFAGNHSYINVIGMNVSREKEEQERNAYCLAQEIYTHLGIEISIPRNAITCFDEYVGPGYAIPTAEMVEAVKLLASTEGILLDPVYTGKAMAGLIDLIGKGYFKSSDNVLFVHSGGAPALYAYTSAFRGKV
jgi:D-cysteine desulfhydrase